MEILTWLYILLNSFASISLFYKMFSSEKVENRIGNFFGLIVQCGSIFLLFQLLKFLG